MAKGAKGCGLLNALREGLSWQSRGEQTLISKTFFKAVLDAVR